MSQKTWAVFLAVSWVIIFGQMMFIVDLINEQKPVGCERKADARVQTLGELCKEYDCSKIDYSQLENIKP